MIWLNGKTAFFIFAFLITIAWLLSSCEGSVSDSAGQKQKIDTFLQALTRADFYQTRKPDSALIFADSAIRLMQNLKLKNSDTLFSLYEIKATAFSEKGLPDSAITMLANLRSETIHATDTLLQAKTALLAGSIALNNKKNEEAEKYLPEAILLFEKLNNESSTAQAYSRYGALLYYKGENNKSLEYLLKAYKIFDDLNNLDGLSSVCLNIGNNFGEIGSVDEELHFYRIALDAAKMAKDTVSQILALNNLGVHYRNVLPDSALFFYQSILALSLPANDIQVIMAKYNIANLYFDQKNYNQALPVYNEVLNVCLAENNMQGVAAAYSGIAAVYGKMGNMEKSIDIIKIAIKFADSIGDVSLVYNLKDRLKIYYEKTGDFKDAYHTAMEIEAFNDSTQALDMKIALHEMEIRYETEKKEAENHRLNLEVASQKQNLKSRAYIIILLVFIALLSIFFSWKGYSLYRERSHAYNVLMKQYTHEKEQKESDEALNITIEKPINSVLSIINSNSLIEKLIQYYRTEKPYLNPKLRVDDVALKLNTSQKAISTALKQYGNSNFNTFTNQFRVDEAKKIMENLSDNFYKVESIAYDSGFGSKSSFYVAFEQFTGIKPSYYRSFMLSKKEEVA